MVIFSSNGAKIYSMLGCNGRVRMAPPPPPAEELASPALKPELEEANMEEFAALGVQCMAGAEEEAEEEVASDGSVEMAANMATDEEEEVSNYNDLED
jgi:hypothetical protein